MSDAAQSGRRQPTIVTDIDIRFGRLIVIFVKLGLAAIPAAIVVSILVTLVGMALSAIFGTVSSPSWDAAFRSEADRSELAGNDGLRSPRHRDCVVERPVRANRDRARARPRRRVRATKQKEPATSALQPSTVSARPPPIPSSW